MPFVQGIQVELITCNPVSLILTYHIIGNPEALKIPPPSNKPQPQDNLWQHTCCEAFIGNTSDTSYHEWNLSPSGNWQVYSFTGYRANQQRLNVTAPVIHTNIGQDHLTITTYIPNSWLTNPYPTPTKLTMGLSVVLADRYGSLYYWALQCPPGKPDFHNRDSWIGYINRG